MPFLRYWLPALTWASILLLASGETFSSTGSGSILGAVLSMIGISLDPERFAMLHFVTRKCAHLLAYGLMGALFFRAVRGPRPHFAMRWALAALALTAAIASLDEWHQSTTSTRTGSPADVLLDLAGAGIALGLIRWRSTISPRAEL